jgi:3'(2'), 5'-bisphosphate nucleotidase
MLKVPEPMLAQTDSQTLLRLAAGLAERAARAILAAKAEGFQINRKDDASLVTCADHAAEKIILAGLREAAPGIKVVAEEECAAGADPAAASLFWLVDPLDGTREFTQGSPDYTVNIGLIADGRPLLGVIVAPETGEMFTGIAGSGAWKRQNGRGQPIAAREAPPQGLTVLSSQHSANQARMQTLLAGRAIAAIHYTGSSLKICRIAEGAADIYPRFGRTMEWDTAAGHAILEAAGGSLVREDGAPLRYGKPGWDNPNFICQGRGLPIFSPA